MNRRRALLQAAAVTLAAIAFLFTASPSTTAFGQEQGTGMVRNGTVGIRNETERQLFWSLLCTCGCPRETLGTCTCGFAHERRAELRAMLEAGRSVEDIKTDYAARFGSVALAVPPNKGSQRAVWLAPLLAMVAGAGIVGLILRRWVKRPAATPETKAAKEPAPADDENKYDDKLDQELKALDRE